METLSMECFSGTLGNCLDFYAQKKKKQPWNKQKKPYDHCSIDLASDFYTFATESECRNSSRNSRVRAWNFHHYEAPYMILMHNQVWPVQQN